MAEKETRNQPKDLIEAVPEEVAQLELEEVIEKEAPVEKIIEEQKKATAGWVPRTKLGKLVREGKEKNLDKILTTGKKILEPEIVDSLLDLSSDLLLVGQAKGKFGGGKRRAWRQTQKKTQEGNVIT